MEDAVQILLVFMDSGRLPTAQMGSLQTTWELREEGQGRGIGKKQGGKSGLHLPEWNPGVARAPPAFPGHLGRPGGQRLVGRRGAPCAPPETTPRTLRGRPADA